MGLIGQVRGFASNVRALLSPRNAYDALPPSVADTIRWGLRTVPNAFGFGTPREMITGSIALALVSVAASVLTFGLTLALLVVWAGTFAVGVLRLVPAVEAYWPLG